MEKQEAVASGVAAAVLSWFKGSAVAQKKHPVATEWTVLAGVVLRVAASGNDRKLDEFRVLACGTGTKCLGRRELDANGLVINDSHAEIVARRAFLRYLYTEALQWSRGEPAAEQSIFERHPETLKLKLKDGHDLHLYISEAPCGDAAIYPLKQDVVDALVGKRMERDAASADRSDMRVTGAKYKRPSEPGDQEENEPQDKRFEQCVGIARTKSGRSDLPEDKQTLSMSCSDKIAKWLAFGVQGVLLLSWFEPVRLSSVVVAGDSTCQSRAAQQRALERALWGRVCKLESCPPVTTTVLPVSEDLQFDRQRESHKTPSPLSVNWTHGESHWTVPSSITNAAFFQSRDVEVLMGVTGFKQGAKKASKMDNKAKAKVASRLCKWRLYQAYCILRQQAAKVEDASSPGVYSDEKSLILAQEGLTDKYETTKRALDGWVGVPASYKVFTAELGA